MAFCRLKNLDNFRAVRQNAEGCILEQLSRMQKYVCTVCGYVYDPSEGDPDGGIAPGTAWENVPDDWVCPVCGAGKGDFELEE